MKTILARQIGISEVINRGLRTVGGLVVAKFFIWASDYFLGLREFSTIWNTVASLIFVVNFGKLKWNEKWPVLQTRRKSKNLDAVQFHSVSVVNLLEMKYSGPNIQLFWIKWIIVIKTWEQLPIICELLYSLIVTLIFYYNFIRVWSLFSYIEWHKMWKK